MLGKVDIDLFVVLFVSPCLCQSVGLDLLLDREGSVGPLAQAPPADATALNDM